MSVGPGPGFLRRAEAMNVAATEEHWALMPADLARRLRPRVTRVGDGLLTLAAGSDALRMNRVIGLGHRGAAQESMIDEIIAIYRAARLRRFSLMLSPGPQAQVITAWLRARGFLPRGGLLLLARDAHLPLPRSKAEVRVKRASRASAPVIVSIQERCFAFPGNRRKWSLVAAAIPTYERYLAYVGATPVAVGALRIEGGLAWLGGAGTLTRWRRRGAQSALIAARLRRARWRGCRWAWVETIAPAPGRPAGSRRNLLRFGFEPVCIKPVFVWRAR
jgi:GNAT superfamily N-acetyltransferase